MDTTLWYSPLGTGDGHDYATRGYLDALMSVGFGGLRVPPSQQTSLLLVGASEDGELARFEPLVKPQGLAPLVRIQPGDPRIGTPKPVGCPDGDVAHGISALAPEDRLYKVGDVDIEGSPPEAFACHVVPGIKRVVIHHDPGSIVRQFSGMMRLGRPESVAIIGMTVWEPDRVPAAIAQVLSELDLLLVPSEHVKEAFVRSGLGARIEVVSHAIDTDRVWTRPDAPAHEGTYGFYTVATPIARKNLDGLIAAYYRAFEGRDADVMLTIKTSTTRQIAEKLTQSAIERAFKPGSGSHKLPPVRWNTKRLSTAGIRELHLANACWVSATRGEGFDLGLAEALLCGNTVVSTNWGASRELALRESNAFLASGVMAPVPTEMAAYGPYAENQQWMDPSLDALVAVLRLAHLKCRPREPAQWDRLALRVSHQAVGERLSKLLLEVTPCAVS